MSSVEDQISNRALQESYHDIVDQINVNEVGSRLFTRNRITLPDLDRLQNLNGNLTDSQKKHYLYSVALADKGKRGLDVFLEVLDETSIQYDPHRLLADKIRTRYKELQQRFYPEQGRRHGKTLASYKSLPDVVGGHQIIKTTAITTALPPDTTSSETNRHIRSPSVPVTSAPISTYYVVTIASSSINDGVPTTTSQDSSQEHEVE